MAGIIIIRGIPENKQITEVRVHTTPGINTESPFRVAIGLQATCDQVVADPAGDNFGGQVYRWFHLTFSDNRQGWVRDDLLDIQGDCSAFGYGNYPAQTFAFTAGTAITAPPPQPPASTPPATQPPLSPVSPQKAATTVDTAPAQPSAPPVSAPISASVASLVASPVTIQPATTTVPVSSPASVPVSQPSGCSGAIRVDIRAKVRSGPSTLADQLAVLDPSTPLSILGVEPGQDGKPWRWMKVNVNGVTGYVREDLLTYSQDCVMQGIVGSGSYTNKTTPPDDTSQITLNDQSLYPSAIRTPYTIFQEFGTNGHKGIDLDVSVGTPIVASGNGVVAYTVKCSKCTDAQPSFASQGLGFWDKNGINDPAWGYGFGNYVVVRYDWHDLPSSMRDSMTAQNLANGHAYVIHGHLSRIDVSAGMLVKDAMQLGLSGNTGNSTGPHLHLEVRISMSPNESTVFNRVVLNPRVMYKL